VPIALSSRGGRARPDAPPPQPPAAPPAPQKPGSGVLPKILIGCLGLVVLLGLVISVAVWWGARKIGLTDAGKNPAAFAAKLIVAGNPELEIADQDDSRQTVTIRNKKTGEVVTVNAGDLKQGKLEFQNDKGEKVTFDAGEKDKGGLTVTTKEGTTRIGAGAAGEELPSWIPALPGAKPTGVMSSKTATGQTGVVTFAVSTPVEQVLDFYETALKGKGFAVERSDVKGEGGALTMGSISAKQEEKREVTVTAVPVEKETQVNLNYTEK
jgi:hypothetical protein